jgi:hypothetical protein
VDENEEFEFRARLEKEQTAKPAAKAEDHPELKTPAETLGPKLGARIGGAIAESNVNLPAEVKGALAATADVLTREGPGLAMGGGVGGAGGRAVSEGLASSAEHLMQSAIKPTLRQLKSGEAATAIRTMLDEGINVSRGGLVKLRAKIDDLNEEIKDRILKSTSTVNKAKVAGYLGDLVNRLKNQVNPQADLASIKKAFNDFMNHPDLAGKTDIPVQQAQQLKQGTYRAVGEKAYGEMKATDVEAQKTLARGLKEEVAKAVPEVRGLNARESDLIKTLNVTERRVLMEANKNPAGLTYLAHNPAAAAAFMADRSALFKSLLGRMLNSASKSQLPQAAGTVAGAGVGTQLPLNAPADR